MDTEQREHVEAALAQMFMQAKMQFGKAIKGYWFYQPDPCPGCGGEIDTGKVVKNDREISLNAFIYRPRGVLIGYFLCNKCAKKIHQAAKRNPGKQISLHEEIEQNLSSAYLKHLH